MSPGNQGVFQPLKEVTFRRILAFCSSWEGCLSCATDRLVGLVREISHKWKDDICFEGCVSVSFVFLNYECYCFLSIYVESNILVHESLL